jgi:hypothetical protein
MTMLRTILYALLATTAFSTAAAADPVRVYKSPTCGCCGKWVEHMRANGFEVQVQERDDLRLTKLLHGVPARLQSCHTAIVDGYVVEGHVPADVVRRLIEERPAVRGVAVPGMPMGSPGMEGPVKQPYAVLTFDDDGNTQVYERR